MSPAGERGLPMPLQALALTGLALVLLVPTFNGLNAASFEDVKPPFEIDPPEDMEPPEDMPPPEDGEYDIPPPAGGGECPLIRDREVWGQRDSFGGPRLPVVSTERGSVTLDVPPNAVGVGIVVNLSSWRGDLDVGPVEVEGTRVADEERVTSSMEAGPTRSGPMLVFEEQRPPPGAWRAEWRATPTYGSGSIGFVMQVAECVEPEESE